MKKILLVILVLALSIVNYAVEPFTFALLTDIHISNGNQKPLEDLQRSVDDINSQSNIAFVLVSGDITEGGDRLAMENVKAQLDRLKIPYYATSGNHETTWSESGVQDFSRVFGDNRFQFSYNGIYFLGFNSGPVIRMADGHVAPQDIDWIKENLDKLPKGTPVIPVTHYPLQNGDVDNWYQVTDVLRQYNVQCVLGGHYHRNLLFNCDGIADVLNRSNLRDSNPVNGYSIISIDNDSIRFNEKTCGAGMNQWLSLPFGTKEYDEPDPALRPSFEVNKQYSEVTELWQTNIRNGIYSTAVLCGKRLYVGDDTGTFYCMNAKNGKIVWTYKTGSRILSTPAVNGKKVVFGSCDNNIYCLSTKGKLQWKVETSQAVMGCPVISGDTAFIGCSDGTFRAMSLKNHGKAIWTYNDLKYYCVSQPCMYDGKIYFGAWDCNFYALNRKDGTLAWKWTNGSTNNKYSPAAVWPVISQDKVFITAPDRYWTCLNAQTGEVIWRTNAHKVRETVGISEDGNTVFSRCMWDSILALDVKANEPKVLWNTNGGYDYDHNPSMLIERDGVVIFGTKNGVLFGVDAKTGEVIWRHKIGNSILNTIQPISGTECIVTSSEGTITRVKVNKKD